MSNMIETHNLSLSYKGKKVIDDLSIQVEAGKAVGLIGPAESGKTILLKLLAGLLSPDEGEIFIDGQEISRMSEVALFKVRRKMGMLFQNNALFDYLNIADNVAFPLVREGRCSADEIEKRVQELLARVGLTGTEHQFPNELSGGMQKRVGVARAAIADADLVLYDEPTSGLDPVSSSKIFRMILDIQHSTRATCVAVSHDVNGLMTICDAFIMLERGRMIFNGSTEELKSTAEERVRRFVDDASGPLQ